MVYEDTELTCADCGNTFLFSGEEQESYATRGYQTPKRCPQCRESRRSAPNVSRANREMHSTTCSRCGNQAQVPFIPKLDRPVYCADCYKLEARA